MNDKNDRAPIERKLSESEQRDRQLVTDFVAVLRSLGTVAAIKRAQISDILTRLSGDHPARAYLIQIEADLVVDQRKYDRIDTYLH